jgi:NAD(P)-dependent dehydrogenase (short-subunit alcohol dehydrogenase family)
MQRTLSNTFFDLERCVAFGKASRDSNPIHVDPVYARRSIAGGCAVHGVLLLLTALEAAFAEGIAKPTRIQADFRKFVMLGDRVELALVEDPGALQTKELRLLVDGRVVAQIVLHFAPAQRGPSGNAEAVAAPQTAFRDVPLDEPPASFRGKPLTIDLRSYGALPMFPCCVATLGALPTHAFCASTYFVGMVCPGLNSIYSSLDFALDGTAGSTQTFELDAYDERMGRFDISASGPLNGRLVAFGRPAPVNPEPISAYTQKVAAGVFAGANALVIGGSRGLGAASAKILALGGAEVALTFALGEADAAAVAAEIEEATGRRPATRRFDFRRDGFAAIADHIAAANAVLMFATPRIRQGKPKTLDRALFETYFEVYVEKLWELASFIEGLRRGTKTVYVPSSTYVGAGSKGFVEYAMAKGAAEAAAADINVSFRHVRVVTTRLPQLKTDQTASRFAVQYVSTFDTLYDALKTVAAGIGHRA